MTRSALCLAAMLAAASFAGVARADDGPAKPSAMPPAKVAAKVGAEPPENCIAHVNGFKRDGGHAAYVVALENKCEQRVSCRIYVNVMNARGTARGHRTLVLAKKSAGAAAKKSYALPVKATGGMIQLSRDCKVLAERRRH